MRSIAFAFCLLWAQAISAQAADELAQRCRMAAGFDERGHLNASLKVEPSAIDLCLQASQAYPDQPDLKAFLGRAMFQNGKKAESAIPIRASAEAGSVVGWVLMGMIHYSGYGVEKDDAQAVTWFRKAAEQGNAWAQIILGSAYSIGDGVDKDNAQAAAWYRKAAEQGLADAQIQLGLMYESGRGVDKDDTQALVWWLKAALWNEDARRRASKWWSKHSADPVTLSMLKNIAGETGLAEELLIMGLFASNEPSRIEEALQRLDTYIKRAVPSELRAFWRRIEGVLLASVFGQLGEQSPGATAV